MKASAQADRRADLALADGLARSLERDGFVVVPEFFALDEVEAARAECVALLERDLAMRRERAFALADWGEGPTPSSSLTEVMHTVLFPILHCPTLAGMIEAIIASPLGTALIRRVVGDDYRLRVDLVRRASGVRDVGPDGGLPHAWHRDRPGEFTFGIFFDDLTRPGSSATAAVPGTHGLPFNPFWDFMLSRPCYRSRQAYLDTQHRYMLDWFFRRNLFQGGVRRALARGEVGMRGKQGDWYLFVNDVWHGREPNLHGVRSVMVRVGGYGSDFPFPGDIPLPGLPDHVPPTLRRRYGREQPVNTSGDSILRRMAKRQARLQLNVFGLARAETRLAGALSRRLLRWRPDWNHDRYLATPK